MARMLLQRDDHDDKDDRPRSGPSIVAIIFIVVVVLFVLAIAAMLVFRHLRARRLGVPANYNPFKRSSSSRNYSSGASTGPLAWFQDRLGGLTKGRHRTAGGAYEEPLGGVGGRRSHRGFGPLDPDEAWDSRVGAEADSYGPGGYYEEQELGLHGGPTDLYGSSEYEGAHSHLGRSREVDDDDLARGRTRGHDPSSFVGGSQRGLDERYDEEMGRSGHDNPFGDAAERSHMRLRELSPMPADAMDRRADGASRGDGADGASKPADVR